MNKNFKLIAGEELLKKYNYEDLYFEVTDTSTNDEYVYGVKNNNNKECIDIHTGQSIAILLNKRTATIDHQPIKMIREGVYQLEIEYPYIQFDFSTSSMKIKEAKEIIHIDLVNDLFQTQSDRNAGETENSIYFKLPTGGVLKSFSLVDLIKIINRLKKINEDDIFVDQVLKKLYFLIPNYSRPRLNSNFKYIDTTIFVYGDRSDFINTEMPDNRLYYLSKYMEGESLIDFILKTDYVLFSAAGFLRCDLLKDRIPKNLTLLKNEQYLKNIECIMKNLDLISSNSSAFNVYGNNIFDKYLDLVTTDDVYNHLIINKSFNLDLRLSELVNIIEIDNIDKLFELYEALDYLLTKYWQPCALNLLKAYWSVHDTVPVDQFDYDQYCRDESKSFLNKNIRERFASDYGVLKDSDLDKLPYVFDVAEKDPLLALNLIASNRPLTKKQKENIVEILK